MSQRKQMSKQQAEEYVKQHGSYAPRDEAYRTDHASDLGTADALWEAAERADGGKTSWPF